MSPGRDRASMANRTAQSAYPDPRSSDLRRTESRSSESRRFDPRRPEFRSSDPRRWLRDLLTLVILVAAAIYLLVPGVGPDLLGLEARYGWNVLGANPQSHQLSPQAQAALQNLRVRPHKFESTKPYHRTAFGQAWADENHNGCNTRNDVLARDLNDVIFRSKRGCKVISGRLAEPYTGKIVNFKSGPKTSPLVQIDHVVALGDAWRSGAQKWDLARRQRFANDPFNLLAVDGDANQEKGSAAADLWLPSNVSYRCLYAARQLAVKTKWNLSVTEGEKRALTTVLKNCAQTPLPPDTLEVKP